ncbi:MAG: hypothetical protein KJO62_09795 [Gammaproteobacteria bacterium]|nr:hypothetical protein [Gammaproteobacteria bacterium]NND39541.1 hypothetical protein [Pseudomonadales bacterium]
MIHPEVGYRSFLPALYQVQAIPQKCTVCSKMATRLDKAGFVLIFRPFGGSFLSGHCIETGEAAWQMALATNQAAIQA